MIITLKPTTAKFCSGFGSEAGFQDFIVFEAQPAIGDRLVDANRDELKQVHWSLTLRDTEVFNPNVAAQGACGIVWRRAKYDTCSASVAIGPKAFQRLLDVLIAGRMPFSVNLSLKSDFDGKEVLKFGPFPDGSELVWDIAASEKLYVTGVEFDAPVGSAALDEDGNPELSALPARAVDVEKLGTDLKRKMQSVSKPLMWIAIGIAILVIRSLFFRS